MVRKLQASPVPSKTCPPRASTPPPTSRASSFTSPLNPAAPGLPTSTTKVVDPLLFRCELSRVICFSRPAATMWDHRVSISLTEVLPSHWTTTSKAGAAPSHLSSAQPWANQGPPPMTSLSAKEHRLLEIIVIMVHI